MTKKIILGLFIITSIFFFHSFSIFANTPPDCGDDIDCWTKYRDTLSLNVSSINNQIKLINSEISLTTLKITQTQKTIKTLETEIDDLTIKISHLDATLNQLSAVYIQQVTQNYKLGQRYPSWSIFLNTNFNHILQEYKYLTTTQENMQNTLISMETTRTQDDIQKATKTQKQQELLALQTKLASQQKDLDGQKSAKNKLLATTQTQLSNAISQINALISFANSAGGSTCLESSPGGGSDGNFYSQRDPRWCKQVIGLSCYSKYTCATLGEAGCYVSSIAMTYKILGHDISPSVYASNPNNFSGLTAYAASLNPPSGYRYTTSQYSSATVDNELNNGRYVIAELNMKGSISGKHFIVIISGSNGNYQIHDPWFGSDISFNQRYTTAMIASLRLITK